MKIQGNILILIKKCNKYPKVKVGDHVRISKHKNIFEKSYVPNWSEEVFVIKKCYKLSSMDICY